MKNSNLKYFFLFLLILISNSVFCTETDTEKAEDQAEKTTAVVSTNVVQSSIIPQPTTPPTDNLVQTISTIVPENKSLFVQTTTTPTTTSTTSSSTSSSTSTTLSTSSSTTTTTTTISTTKTTNTTTSSSSSKSSSPTPNNNNKHDNGHNSGSNGGSSSDNHSDNSHSNNDNNSSSGSNSNNNNNNQQTQQQTQQQAQQDQQQTQQDQQNHDKKQTSEQIATDGNSANQSSNTPNSTNNAIGTINTGKVDGNNKKDGGTPIWYIILGVGLVAAIVAAVIGFTVAVQRKKKNNDQLSANMWTVPDDFDSRVIPIAPPANTYNMNNTPISQPMYQANTYGQAPVMTEAYNSGQPAYVEPTDAQMPPTTTSVAVPVDTSYSNDYGNAQSNNEYIPNSIDELKVNNVYASQFTFQPELDDEIEINIDDQVYIEEIFADNWALGVNTVNNARGCFPLNIFLNPKSTLDNSRSQRTLSYCSTGNSAAY